MDQPATNLETQKIISNPNIETVLMQSKPDPTFFINTLIQEAVYLSTSDILLEPRKDKVLIRFRIDGVLYELGSTNFDAYSQIASRIKILCNLDITKKKKVQEGQFTIGLEGGEISLRVEIVGTILGELTVLRIHEKKTIIMALSSLGFSEKAFNAYQKMISQKKGLILSCGPTGCGKTTTLYSTINKLNENKEYNVMTIEDPVEFRLEGLNQMQAQETRGFTFAVGLKTILRLSPDIILVGEIRDRETAEIAVESGLTGQLVLSTIHAEDSIGALFRLLDLEIEPYLLNSSLTGIVAQRLVRKNCAACLETYQPTQEELDLFTNIAGHTPNHLIKSRGCEQCQNMKFKGRVGIYEVLVMNARVRDLIRNKVNETELRNTLVKEGLVTLLRDGLEKAEQGITTVQEALRNSLRVD